MTVLAAPFTVPADSTPSPTTRRAWAGRVLSGIAILFLAVDAAFKLIGHPMAIQTTVDLGYPASAVPTIGILGALCTVLYAVPRTAIVGAILWTGYLGGAVATHFRVDNPLWTHTLFPLYVAAFVWGGLALRDRRVFALAGLRA